MNRFTIIDGLPYLVSHGHVYTVCLNDVGFTVGALTKKEAPKATLSEISVRAKCGPSSSIKKPVRKKVIADDPESE